MTHWEEFISINITMGQVPQVVLSMAMRTLNDIESGKASEQEMRTLAAAFLIRMVREAHRGPDHADGVNLATQEQLDEFEELTNRLQTQLPGLPEWFAKLSDQ